MPLITKSFEFQAKELEAGIARCEYNIRLFQSQVDQQLKERPVLELKLQELKIRLGSYTGDQLETAKRSILTLEDNLERCKKNIDIYSQEVEKQRELKSQLQLELQELKIKQQKNAK